jgi:prepilin-type N-terminal cleavage/methylation domain-containing protein
MNMPDPLPVSARAFTLIELLMVVAIIVLLTSMLFPVLSVIRSTTMKERTTFIERKADTALRLFKGDWGVYPYQSAYPDLSAGETFTSVPNHLNYRVGTDISTTQAGKNVKQDMIAAGLLYDMTHPTAVTYTQAESLNGWAIALLLNRMASEQQSLAVLAGNLNMRGQIISSVNNGTCSVTANLVGTRVLSAVSANAAPYNTVASQANTPEPGWAADYLQGEVDKKFISADGLTVLDAWRNPLIYICQAVPGMRTTDINVNIPSMGGWGSAGNQINNRTFAYDPRVWGLGGIGFDPTTGPGPSVVAANRELLLYGGRIRLSAVDAGDGLATPQDGTYFPNPANLMHSDMRYYAAPGFETEFELWSAGRDGKFDWFRDDSANDDNISTVNYNKAITNG